MEITSIKESGSNNILLWAIKNGAEVKVDDQLVSIVNDELFYLLTLSDVNFFEVFRLSQMYREKLRILKEEKADVPPRTKLLTLFNGECSADKENEPDKKIPLYELVEHVCQNFINLVLQMDGDDDIINQNALRLFLPMLTRRFTVQIPFGFADLVTSLSPQESSEVFNEKYPETLSNLIESETNGLKQMFTLAFVKSTSIIRYNKRYDKYINITKYSPLKTSKTNPNKLYKVALLGFFKYDNISRGEVRCNMFNVDKDNLVSKLKQLNTLSTPLYIDFVVELPIQYMQIILNSFGREMLTISYESSMSTIINGGLEFNDFVIPEVNSDNSLSEEETSYIEEKNNAIEAYKIRISEANQILLNTIPLILDNDNADVDVTSTFALLPSIYRAKAVFTINVEKANDFINHYDPLISEMFKEMFGLASGIITDIKTINEK